MYCWIIRNIHLFKEWWLNVLIIPLSETKNNRDTYFQRRLVYVNKTFIPHFRSRNLTTFARQECDFEKSCGFIGTPQYMGNPCKTIGDVKYTRIRYNCIPISGESNTLISCQHYHLLLDEIMYILTITKNCSNFTSAIKTMQIGLETIIRHRYLL